MLIQPKIRGFICTSAHPTGCEDAVILQISQAKLLTPQKNTPKKVLVIGASTGYGLASRITAAFGYQAATIGVLYERPSIGKRTASAGWYNTAAFEKIAHGDGLYAKSINGDAFSNEIREQTADLIRQDLGKIDLLIYSLASPRRTHPDTGTTFSSVLKPVGKNFTSRTVDAFKGEVKDITLEPASEQEVADTITVMGGDDWERWIDFLTHEDLLAKNIKTVAYSYIGPELTHAIYKDGAIGQAKKHLHKTAVKLNKKLNLLEGEAVVAINKAVVTQASAAIPVVPLYMSLLFKFMKEKGTHEGCIEQMIRLFNEYLYADKPKQKDTNGLIRLDDLEMDQEIQQKVANTWNNVTTENIEEITDINEYRKLFYQLFGFALPNIDYQADVSAVVDLKSL